MTEIPVWLLMVYTLSTFLTITFIIWQARQVRKYTRLSIGLSHALHECNGVLTALAARGNLVCDECHQPIAPMTPTLIEEQEGGWSIAHDHCP